MASDKPRAMRSLKATFLRSYFPLDQRGLLPPSVTFGIGPEKYCFEIRPIEKNDGAQRLSQTADDAGDPIISADNLSGSAGRKLGQRLDQLAGTLSGGERKMLAIGRAMLGNPKLLLVDEPTESGSA